MHVADERLERWFAHVLGSTAGTTTRETRERTGIRGRLALVMADVPGRWPQHFLADTPPPPELISAMRASYLDAGPELKLTAMVPRKIDLGRLASVADETWKTFQRNPFLRAFTGWLIIITLLALTWIITHP